eukprot:351980-Chlamydomonas_euryale.AAC.2
MDSLPNQRGVGEEQEVWVGGVLEMGSLPNQTCLMWHQAGGGEGGGKDVHAVFTHTHTHARTHAHTQAHMHACTHARKATQACTRAHTLE